MTDAPAPSQARFSAWCGWVLAGVAAVAPIIGWLGPLAFAPVVGLGGLLTLPAARVSEAQRPAAIAILVVVIWAAGSMLWSPYRPEDLEGATALKLAAMALLFWSLHCAAGRASAPARVWALRALAWGMAGLGVILLLEGLTAAGLYQALRTAMHDPIRPDLAAKNVAVGAFVLTVLWAPAALAASRVARAGWLALPMAAGVVGVSITIGADAPLFALAIGILAGLAVWRWPTAAPRALAGMTALFFLLTPTLLTGLRDSGRFETIQQAAPLSWSQRMGYWRHAVDWITDHPLRGWGLDASRMFAPGIQLHPHDASLQIWLELGVIGAMAAAVFWIAVFVAISRRKPDAAMAAAAASAVSFLVFGAVSFGIWQEWWLAVGGLSAAFCAALARQPALAESHDDQGVAARTSTIGPVSE